MDELLTLLPAPASVEVHGAACRMPLHVPLVGSAANEAMEEWLTLQPFAEAWVPEFVLATSAGHVTPPLIASFDPSLTNEAYRLQIKTDSVRLSTADKAGLFYALITLLQLLAGATREGDELVVPTVEIEDRPRFRWRGMHLDVVRHFFPVDVIKRYLDVLALHKINVFHWHLTDDQGWRIEIKSHPKLTEIGAWRTEADGTRHGGYYTQDEIRDVVNYAAERHITVVPEIEVPGHARAALAAYPKLSCTGETQSVPTTWGIFDDVFCVGNENTITFLEDVLTEVFDLFPCEFVHIGGDECPNIRWQACPKCQQRMQLEKVGSFAELQHWFTRRIEGFLNAHGKRLIGWDEILVQDLPKSAAVMAWRSTQQGQRAAEAGHDVVMSPTTHCYFDYAQAEHGEPEAFEATLTLEQVAKFDPAPSDWPESVRTCVLGGQGNLWTERIDNESHLQYMLLPRLCALSECLWSQAQARPLSALYESLEKWLELLAKLGFNSRNI